MSLDYLTVIQPSENLTVIERSKFICYLKGVENEEQAKEFITEIKKKNSLATHNCYAYIADDKGLVAKFSDDGEPQGTAGLPMLEVLKNKRCFKTVAVVTRYFGGIKLGTGGLTRAYSGAVIDGLDKTKTAIMKQVDFISVCVDYDGYSRLLKLLPKEVKIIDSAFETKIVVNMVVDSVITQIFTDKLVDAFNGNIIIEKTKNGFYGF